MLRMPWGYFVAVSLIAGAQPACASGEDIASRVDSIVEQMTLAEKIDLLGGERFFDVDGVPRLGIPTLLTADGPFGVRRYARANVMAGGIALAATWNRELGLQVGTQMGRDARARGVHFYLAPGVNIYRAAQNGRNFEYLGEDPFLASRVAVEFIRGVQAQGVAATVKHFLANNSEFARHTSDSVVDERALREIYMPAFEAAVKEAGVAAVMDSYNLVNGEHMSQSRRFNVDLLKEEWSFNGVVMSDWDATYDTLGAANGGLDLEMPSGKYLNRSALEPLIQAGKVSQATIDDKVRRIVRTAVRFDWLDRPQLDTSIAQFNAQGRAAALQTAREGMVLLKNERDVLPFDRQKIRRIALIGPHAYPAVPHGGGSVTVAPFRAVSFLEGLNDHLGSEIEVQHARGVMDLKRAAQSTVFSTTARGGKAGLNVEIFDNADLSGTPATTRIDPYISQGAPIDLTAFATGELDLDFSAFTGAKPPPVSARWTGYYTPSAGGEHDVFVQSGGFERVFGYRLYVDDKLIADRWNLKIAAADQLRIRLDASPHRIVLEHRSEKGGFGTSVPFVRLGIVPLGRWIDPSAERLAAQADTVVVAVGFDPSTETEDWDRGFSLPPGQNELISRIAAANRNTLVVITSGGAVDMSAWLDAVPAVLQAWYPGQEGGQALAEIAFGDVNPSGRLPATFERQWKDNPAYQSYYPQGDGHRIVYKEGIFVGYRGYEQKGTKPLFAFGHGLSYTTFGYGNLKILTTSAAEGNYQVSFEVTNKGQRAGAAVAQLYISDRKASVPRPPKELKGFEKVFLQPGETRTIIIPLDARSLAFYDVASGQWRAEAGAFDVLVGDASDRIALKGQLTLPVTINVPAIANRSPGNQSSP